MSQEGKDVEGRIGYTVKRLQMSLRSAGDGVLRPLGLTMPQYAALSAVARHPGLNNSDLARLCFVTRQTMNELLAGLHRAELVTRADHPRDRRVRQIELSATGRDVLERADRLVGAVEQRMTAGLDATERRELLELLTTCAESLEIHQALSPG